MGTTYALILQQHLRVIEALTPTFRADVKFRRHRDAVEFVKWVEESPEASFRQFEVLSNFDPEFEGIGDGDKFQIRQSMTVLVAYPRKGLGKYGINNERDMDVVIDDDFHQINGAIGALGSASGNWVNGLDDCQVASLTINKSESAYVAASTYRLLYDRSY